MHPIHPGALAFAITAALALPVPSRSCSMCRCDDPAHTLAGSPLLNQRSWGVSLETERFAKDQVVPEDPTLREQEHELRYTLSGSWAPLRHLTLAARAPYSDRTISAGPVRATRAGFSDAELTATVSTLRGGERPLWLALLVGVRLPSGRNDLAINGARAEEHLQPGTGAAGLLAGLALVHPLGEHDALYGGVHGRWNDANRHDYRYGDVAVANLGWQHEFTSWLEAGPELDFRAARHDVDAGVRDPDTGGALLYLTPRAELRLTERLALRLGVQLPVADALYGDQRERINLQTGLSLRR